MGKFFSAIGGFFVNIYKAVVSGGDPTIATLPANLQITPAEIDECIKAVNIVKDVVNNPVTVLVTDLTPISMDNDIRLAISNALPTILNDLTMAETVVADAKGGVDDAATVNAQLALVRLSSDPAKDAFYHALCARLIMIAANGKVNWSDAVSILEIYFKQMFGTTAVADLNTVAAAIPPVIQAVNTRPADESPVANVANDVEAVADVIAPVVDKVAPAAAPIVGDVDTAIQEAAPVVVDLSNLTEAQKAAAIAAVQNLTTTN